MPWKKVDLTGLSFISSCTKLVFRGGYASNQRLRIISFYGIEPIQEMIKAICIHSILDHNRSIVLENRKAMTLCRKD